MSHREEGAKFLKETSSPRLDALTKILSLTKLESGYSEPSSQPDLNLGPCPVLAGLPLPCLNKNPVKLV